MSTAARAHFNARQNGFGSSKNMRPVSRSIIFSHAKRSSMAFSMSSGSKTVHPYFFRTPIDDSLVCFCSIIDKKDSCWMPLDDFKLNIFYGFCRQLRYSFNSIKCFDVLRICQIFRFFLASHEENVLLVKVKSKYWC